MYGAALSKDLNLSIQHHHQQQQPVTGVRTPPQMSSPGLLRYRSAPSTLLGDVCGDFLPATGAGDGHRQAAGSPDHAADTVFARFLAAPPRPAAAPGGSHFSADNAASIASHQQQQQLMYQSQQQMAAMEGLFRTSSSVGPDPAGGGNDGLLRQSSSPAGFLNHLNMDNGSYGNMLRAGMAGGGYRNGDGRLKGQLSFSSRQGSVMSQISEMVSEELGGGGGSDDDDDEAGSNSAARGCGYGHGHGGIPGAGYPMGGGGWDEPSPSLPPSSEGLSAAAGTTTKRPKNGASRQFSLPTSGGSKPSPEMAAIEKFLQFQDAVPCKIRAKRGCATHPRSIAERVRRTKISERIRKLQELVPNMEKQTNTSDMLDLAVDYIKELQMQVKVMNDGRTTCTCSASRQKRFAG